jgi:hypothetical protein
VSWGDFVTTFLPLVLLIGFWLVLMRGVGRGRFPNPTADKLEEIRHELELIRRALERDPYTRR